MMTDLIFEPAVWLLGILMVCALIKLVSSFYLRPVRRRLIVLANQIAADGKLSRADKAWLREALQIGTKEAVVAAPFAPFFIIGAIAVGAAVGWRDGNMDQQADQIEAKADQLRAETVRLTEGVDPTTGRFWHDPRRREIERLAFTIETWRSPIAMTWVFLWLTIAAPALFVAYLVSGTIRPFVINLWGPLQAPVVAIFDALHITSGRSASNAC